MRRSDNDFAFTKSRAFDGDLTGDTFEPGSRGVSQTLHASIDAGNIETSASMRSKNQLVTVGPKNNTNVVMGQVFQARYQLQTTGGISTNTATESSVTQKIFSSLFRYFSTDNVEMKRANQFPIYFLDKNFMIDRDN